MPKKSSQKLASKKGVKKKIHGSTLKMKRNQQAFLKAFAKTGILRSAAEAAKVDRQAHYDWMEKDEEYAEAFEKAREDAADMLEAEALRRAVEGVEEPVYYQGVEVGTTTRYSDTLLIFKLKGERPEKFKDRHAFSGEVKINSKIKAEHSIDSKTLEEASALYRQIANSS